MKITLSARRWQALRWLTAYLRGDQKLEGADAPRVFWTIGTLISAEVMSALAERGSLARRQSRGRPRISQPAEKTVTFAVSPLCHAGLRALSEMLEASSVQEAVAEIADAVLSEAPDVARGERAMWDAIAPGLGTVVDLVRQRCSEAVSALPSEGAANA